MSKTYHDLSDDEIRRAARQIVSDSSSDDEIRAGLRDKLGYPYSAAITSCQPADQVGREARAIAQGLGGLVRKDGAMVMVMMHSPRGDTISL